MEECVVTKRYPGGSPTISRHLDDKRLICDRTSVRVPIGNDRVWEIRASREGRDFFGGKG